MCASGAMEKAERQIGVTAARQAAAGSRRGAAARVFWASWLFMGTLLYVKFKLTLCVIVSFFLIYGNAAARENFAGVVSGRRGLIR